MQPEWLGCGRGCRFEQADQAFTFGRAVAGWNSS